MATDNLQHQRLELKYIIPEETALAVRDFVRPVLALDEYAKGQPDYSYPIHSLYLDSDLLTFYWHTINGNKNRLKLRVRFYDDSPDTPVFFEIKRRMNDAIFKQRGGVRRSAVTEVLAGRMPLPEEVLSKDPKHTTALANFCRIQAQYLLAPKALVSYRREAWISPHNNSVRVTLDREVKLGLQSTAELNSQIDEPVAVFGNDVILELKFTGRFPVWFGELVRHFGLWKCSAAKYADGMTLMRETGRRPVPMAVPETSQAVKKLASRKAGQLQFQERSRTVFA